MRHFNPKVDLSCTVKVGPAGNTLLRVNFTLFYLKSRFETGGFRWSASSKVFVLLLMSIFKAAVGWIENVDSWTRCRREQHPGANSLQGCYFYSRPIQAYMCVGSKWCIFWFPPPPPQWAQMTRDLHADMNTDITVQMVCLVATLSPPSTPAIST